ncbi:MAG: HEAT repeat domain-containing protein [Dehalococcoidia bacterium]
MPPASRSVSQIIEMLQAGSRPSSVQMTALSDLSPEDAARMGTIWPGVAQPLRLDLAARARELAEDNADLHFGALGRIALGDLDPAVQRFAIDALWESEDRMTGAELGRVLLTDPDNSVRAAAASALGPFVLRRELVDADPPGDALVEALRTAASDSEPSADVRARAIESLGPRTLPWVEELINSAYYDDDRRLRLAAIRAMGGTARDEWVDVLAEQARSDDPEYRYETALALGQIGSDASIDLLVELAEDDDPEVMVAALGALGGVGGPDVIERLKDLGQGAPPHIQEAIAAAIEAATYLEDRDLLVGKIGLG